MRNIQITLFMAISLISSLSVAKEAPVASQNVVQPVTTAYSCEEAHKLKFDEKEYMKLDGTSRVLVDAQWQQCEIRKDASRNDEQIVLVVNPTPLSDNDRLFYGILKRNQLTEAQKTCTQAGQVGGAAIAVSGTALGQPLASEVGQTIFQYSEVSCSSISDQLAKGNVLAALMPNMIVGHAVLTKITKDTVTNIPLLSGADKKKMKEILGDATSPPSLSISGKNVVVKVGPVKASFPKKCCKFKI